MELTKNIKKIIEQNPLAFATVWKGYQFLGKAEYYTKGKWLNYVKNLKANKEFPAKGAIVIKVEKIIESK